ncbi:MAG TPA: pseudouridine synthase [Chthoniobacterales bacterium]|jgi:23S rRNA pseudouridine2605 synthase
MRLNRFLASAGLGSRRSCEALISEGKVTINGRVCVALATEVAPEDHVKVGNKLVHVEQPTYVILNKPRGYVTTMSDEFGRRTIEDLLPRNWPRLFHVGRLDKDSEGLLLLTNDGELAQKLTHPKHKIEKEYEVLLDKPYDSELTPKLKKGIVLEQGRGKIERLQIVKPNHLRVVLAQGLKRQIRLMFASVGYEVMRLCRTRIGPIRLGELPSGSYRLLTDRELRLIHEHLTQKPAIERIRHPDAKVS